MWLELILIILSVVAYKVSCCYLYWRRRGVATVGVPVPFFGNVCEHLFLRKSYGKVIFEWYSRFKGERFVGFYVSSKPFLLVTDPSLAKEIMVDRFDKFSDRGHIRTKEIDPLSENLITLHGRQWTESRRAVQPALNSAKLRPILPVWNGCCGGLADGFRSDYDGGRPSAVSLRLQHSLLEMFVTSCLGITYESFLKNSLLKQISEELINPTRLTSVRTLMMFVCPRLINFLGWRRFSNDKIDYLRNFYKELYRLRKERNGGDRPDLFLTLTEVHRSENIKQLFRDPEWMSIANIQILLVAGYDSVSSVLTLLLWELARNEDVQSRLYTDVSESLRQHDGRFDYDALADMPYLDAVINETLRLYPPFPFTMRRCNAAHRLTEGGPLLAADDNLIIPIEAFHHDPDHYPDPLRFDPDRFYNRSLDTFNKTYFPFGRGPRNCVGYMFAKTQMRLVCAVLISKLVFKLGPETVTSVDFKYHVFGRKLSRQIYLYAEPR